MDESISDTSETYHPFYRVEFYGAKRIFPNSHEFLIGRGGLSNLRVVSNTVSRQHCAIKWTEDGWKVINKSVNGTSINGFITTNPYPRDLTNSDIIVIGDVFLQCFLEVNNDLYRLPVRILRIVVLVGFDNCSLLPEDLEEPQLERLIALITAEIGKEEKLKIESKMINAQTNSQESLMESEGNKESALEKFNFLIKNNLMLSKELEESNKAYRKALSEKEDATLKLNQIRQDVSTSLEGLVETELKCSICYEIVINATTTNCSHTFCELCFLKWTKKNNVCPVCRASISSHVRTKMIDNYVEKLIMNFPEEFQQKRKEMVDSRNELTNALKETSRPAKRRKRTVTAAARNGRRAITITLQNLASLMDTTIDISSDDESPVVLFEQSLQP